MHKTILTVAALALIWIGYTAWPLYDLYQLARAVEHRDVATVTRAVNFGRLRASFTDQLGEAYLRKSGARVPPMLQGAVMSIADPIIVKFISPEALAEFLRVGWPVGALPDRPRETVGLSVEALGSLWEVFKNSEYGLGRFEVIVPVTVPSDRAFTLTFRVAQWRWQLTRIKLPDYMADLLVDEIIKTTKPPPH